LWSKIKERRRQKPNLTVKGGVCGEKFLLNIISLNDLVAQIICYFGLFKDYEFELYLLVRYGMDEWLKVALRVLKKQLPTSVCFGQKDSNK